MADTVFYNYSGKKSIREIARIAEAELVTAGKENELIENICSIESAGSEDLCIFYDRKNKSNSLHFYSRVGSSCSGRSYHFNMQQS